MSSFTGRITAGFFSKRRAGLTSAPGSVPVLVSLTEILTFSPSAMALAERRGFDSSEGGVGEPVPEGEERLDALGVVPAVAYQHSSV
ncbi:MAG: hypothetical protein ACLSGF_13650 [Alistipes onderdonkii]